MIRGRTTKYRASCGYASAFLAERQRSIVSTYDGRPMRLPLSTRTGDLGADVPDDPKLPQVLDREGGGEDVFRSRCRETLAARPPRHGARAGRAKSLASALHPQLLGSREPKQIAAQRTPRGRDFEASHPALLE